MVHKKGRGNFLLFSFLPDKELAMKSTVSNVIQKSNSEKNTEESKGGIAFSNP
jgi:hypothetical protein